MLPALLLALLLGAALVVLVAFLEARAARRPYERALDELVAEARDERALAIWRNRYAIHKHLGSRRTLIALSDAARDTSFDPSNRNREGR